jgi:hypothetical protein
MEKKRNGSHRCRGGLCQNGFSQYNEARGGEDLEVKSNAKLFNIEHPHLTIPARYRTLSSRAAKRPLFKMLILTYTCGLRVNITDSEIAENV